MLPGRAGVLDVTLARRFAKLCLVFYT